eukprot:TRINITY_DN23510_c0_g1_i3.p1 TRINITY_DN23510_c0_g1~~TRINITY_DN23510_c0_g1_i3.p1  ORF type:complete len:560 (-),score=57.06 TRINITY_DN23510_c0_g1_i3:201-1880(-)
MKFEEEIVRCSIGFSALLFITLGIRKHGTAGIRHISLTMITYARNCTRSVKNEKTAIEEIASALFEQRVHERSRRLILSSTLLLTPTALNCARNGFAALRSNLVTVDATSTPALGLLPLNLMAALCLVRQQEPSRTSSSMFHVVLFACFMQMLWNTESTHQLLADNVAMICLRLAILLTPGRFASGFMFHFCYSVCLIIKLIQLDAGTPELVTIMGQGYIQLFIEREGAFFITTTALIYFIDAATFRESLATTEAQMSDMWKTAFSELQDATCSVTVELDDDTRILDDGMKLAGFLLMEAQSLKEHQFCNYVDKGDVDTVKTFFTAQKENFQSLPCSVCLRDCLGNKVPVQMYHTQFVDLFQRRHHVVGIVEIETESTIREDEENLSLPLKALPRPRRKSQGSHHGTATTHQQEELADLMTGTAVPCRTLLGALANRRFQQTSEGIKVMAIRDMFHRWNLQLNRHACCPMHSYIQDCEAILKLLRRTKCEHEEEFVAAMADHQCPHCGMVVPASELNSDEGTCFWCGRVGNIDLRDLPKLSFHKKIGCSRREVEAGVCL